MKAVEKNFLHLLAYFQYFDLSPFDKPVSHIYRTPFVFLCFLWICIFMFDFLLEVYLQWGHLNFLLEEFTFCPLYLLLLLEYKKVQVSVLQLCCSWSCNTWIIIDYMLYWGTTIGLVGDEMKSQYVGPANAIFYRVINMILYLNKKNNEFRYRY